MENNHATEQAFPAFAGLAGPLGLMHTAMNLPLIVEEMNAALTEASSVAMAARLVPLADTWQDTTGEVRSALLLSLAWGSRGHALMLGDGLHPATEGYAADLHDAAEAEPDGGDKGSEKFHGAGYPAMPLPGKAGILASSLGFDRDDAQVSLEVALVLLHTGRAAWIAARRAAEPKG